MRTEYEIELGGNLKFQMKEVASATWHLSLIINSYFDINFFYKFTLRPFSQLLFRCLSRLLTSFFIRGIWGQFTSDQFDSWTSSSVSFIGFDTVSSSSTSWSSYSLFILLIETILLWQHLTGINFSMSLYSTLRKFCKCAKSYGCFIKFLVEICVE